MGLSAYLNSFMPPIPQLTPGCRSLANGMIVGTSEGFAKDLQLIGVGYRGSVAGKTLTMNLGFSHPVVMTIPDDVEVKVLCKPTSVCFGLTFEMIRNGEAAGQYAACIIAMQFY